jgi:lysozyme
MRKILLACAVLLGLALIGEVLYREGLIRFNYPDEKRFPVRGIDVSHHQGPIDWEAVAASGVAFAYIKATEGGDHHDRHFRENWRAAGAAGLARGAYHFFTFCTPGDAQAENFLGVVADLRAELPPVADVEFSGNCKSWESVDDIRTELSAFLARVEQGTGRKPVLYYTRDARIRVIEGYFHHYPSWPRNVFYEPVAQGTSIWSFWQFADNARVPGISGAVDLNVFRGSLADFEELAGRRPPP